MSVEVVCFHTVSLSPVTLSRSHTVPLSYCLTLTLFRTKLLSGWESSGAAKLHFAGELLSAWEWVSAWERLRGCEWLSGCEWVRIQTATARIDSLCGAHPTNIESFKLPHRS